MTDECKDAASTHPPEPIRRAEVLPFRSKQDRLNDEIVAYASKLGW